MKIDLNTSSKNNIHENSLTKTMKNLTYQQKCFQWASNQFLYEEVPDEYFEMSEEDQHKHLEEYAWEAVEHYDGYKLSNIIDSLAEHIIQEIYPKKEDFKND